MKQEEEVTRKCKRVYVVAATLLVAGLLICLAVLASKNQSANIYTNDGFPLLRGTIDCSKSTSGPFIYATTHDEVPNILKYTLQGCLVSDKVLRDGPELEDHDTEFRSMTLGRYQGQDALFIADAMSKDSFVFVYSDCDHNGQRSYIETALSSEKHEGMDHTYGICFDEDRNLYVSNQHTDNVMRFTRDSFQPMALPQALLIDGHHWRDYYEGTFVQFGRVGVHGGRERGVRSILRYKDTIWIANEDLDGVAVASISTGIIYEIIVVHNPIGLFHDHESGLIFVSSKQKHWKGAVYAISPDTLRVVSTFTTIRMTHPTGITVYQDLLYVAEQVLGEIVVFRVSTQEYLGHLVKKTPGQIEQLLLSPC